MYGNQPSESRYFFVEVDSAEQRPNGANRYTVTFPKGGTPPATGFWSLTMYGRGFF
ncbi:DUF1214 domain-containing protein [Caballeronia sp. NK8]|uniref:DUF1214 domain-containing protein n=1 Tax=Caballeronia sp. NK8 TaxID=140098 RepID=UPI003464E0E2